MSIEKHPSAPSVALELLERLRALPVELISDQLHRNRGFARFRPYHEPAPLAGTAVTVRTRAGDNLAEELIARPAARRRRRPSPP